MTDAEIYYAIWGFALWVGTVLGAACLFARQPEIIAEVSQ